MKGKGTLALVLVLGAGVAWYIVSPGRAIDQLQQAAEAGDTERLNELVHFEQVRENLKGDVRTLMASELERNQSDGAALGALFGGMLLDPMIDLFVTPRGIAAVSRGRLPGILQRDDDPVANDAERKIDRQGLNRFVVRYEDDAGRVSPGLVFRRDGLSWRLVRIELPGTVRPR